MIGSTARMPVQWCWKERGGKLGLVIAWRGSALDHTACLVLSTTLFHGFEATKISPQIQVWGSGYRIVGKQCPSKMHRLPKVRAFMNTRRRSGDAHVREALIITSGITSILAGIFDVKHYFHLQVRWLLPVQLWRCEPAKFASTHCAFVFLVHATYLATSPGNNTYLLYGGRQRVWSRFSSTGA